jgi:hypothetical protein
VVGRAGRRFLWWLGCWGGGRKDSDGLRPTVIDPGIAAPSAAPKPGAPLRCGYGMGFGFFGDIPRAYFLAVVGSGFSEELPTVRLWDGVRLAWWGLWLGV